MRAVANFDGAGELNLIFRKGRAGSKLFTFTDGEDPVSLSGYTFQLNVYRASGNVFQLTSGSGLTIEDNTITVSVNETQSNQAEVLHYWELYETTTKQTWLFGHAQFISKDPRGSDETAVVVTTSSVTVTINSVGGTGGAVGDIDGGSL